MGCLNKVFSAEIDLDMFLLAERAGGYGGIKMTGDPLPQCQFTVEKAYEGEGPAYECVNRRFFDANHRRRVDPRLRPPQRASSLAAS